MKWLGVCVVGVLLALAFLIGLAMFEECLRVHPWWYCIFRR